MISALPPPERNLAAPPERRNDTKQNTAASGKAGFGKVFDDAEKGRRGDLKGNETDETTNQAVQVIANIAVLNRVKTGDGHEGPAAKKASGSKFAPKFGAAATGVTEIDQKAVADRQNPQGTRADEKTAIRRVSSSDPELTKTGTQKANIPANAGALPAVVPEADTKKSFLAKRSLEKPGVKSDKKEKVTTDQPTATKPIAAPQVAPIESLNSLSGEKTDAALEQDKSQTLAVIGWSQVKHGAAISVGAGPTVARSVAVQISQAALNGGNQTVEITLDPIELGKVKLRLSPTDIGITVQIIAERADTIDLMRRHSSMLTAEFQDLGYDNIDFAFSQNSNDAQAQAGDAPSAVEWAGEGRAAASVSPVVPARAIIRLGSDNSLDIRL